MFSFSASLRFNKQRISSTGEVSLYMHVIINREIKKIPLMLKWPADKINLETNTLLSRYKKDNEVNDYNLIIQSERAKYTEIHRIYRIRNEELTLKKFLVEIQTFDSKECFSTYLEQERNRRYKRGEIEKKTWQNANATRMAMLKYDKLCLFKDINSKWLKGFQLAMQKEKLKPGTIWARIATVKAYLQLANKEPLLHVHPDVLEFSNPKPKTKTVYLVEEEIRRLVILLDGDLTDRQSRVLKAFLFTCFTSLRVSDVYKANSEWEIQDNFLEFIPFKNRKKGRVLKIPILPIAKRFINKGNGLYFDLPNSVQYNETLKELATKAIINKNLTSHVGRHTFGYLYMVNVGNIYGLQQILGHSKIETTERYAHLDDDYQFRSARKIQDGFADLMLKII